MRASMARQVSACGQHGRGPVRGRLPGVRAGPHWPGPRVSARPLSGPAAAQIARSGWSRLPGRRSACAL